MWLVSLGIGSHRTHSKATFHHFTWKLLLAIYRTKNA